MYQPIHNWLELSFPKNRDVKMEICAISFFDGDSKHSVQGFPWVFSCKNIFLEWYLDPIKETFNKNTDSRIESKFHILNNEHVENHILQYQITLKNGCLEW